MADGRWLVTGGRIDRRRPSILHRYGGWVGSMFYPSITVDSVLRSKIHNIDIQFRPFPMVHLPSSDYLIINKGVIVNLYYYL
jgi:hypothetical protein